MGCRAGTRIFGHFAGVGGGAVRVFCFLGSCFGGYGMIEQVGVAGQYGFSSFLVSVSAGTVRLKWWGGAVFLFSLSLVCCQFSWRVDMRGRDTAFYLLWYL